MRIERSDHLTELVTETIDGEAEHKRCLECGERGRLFVFYTQRGAHQREHKGTFCGKECHDIWHGLAPRVH